MAPIGTIWGDIRQRQTKVILSIAALNGLDLQQAPFEFGVTNKSPEFLSKFPYGKIPAFEDSEGWKLTEGTTIARYLSDIGGKSDFLGSNAKETALVDQWIHFAEHEIGAPVSGAFGLVYGSSGPFTRERLVRALTYLESYLATRPSGYLVGNSVTLADFVLVGVVHQAAIVSLGAAERAQYTLIFAHLAKVTGDERFKQYWSTEKFVEVAATEPKTLDF
ncbi:glutathione S-transferase C-terminal-like protein [Melanogaster broomeanus]|nr:glutathione S-transferase C-terminal-like protein [Melanogaster broomeanus]